MAKRNVSKQRVPVDDASVAEELVSIRRLMVLALLRDGASQSGVSAALGVSQPSVSRMFPGGLTSARKSRD